MAVQNALNMVVPLKSPEDLQELLRQLDENWDALMATNDAVGTLHFMRFVALDDKTLGLFTIYDGDFESYVQDFLKYVGPLFDMLVSHAADPTPQPVQKNPQEFTAWAKAHDLPSFRGIFSAYPDLSVQDIKALAAK